jgi:hypothetical protein
MLFLTKYNVIQFFPTNGSEFLNHEMLPLCARRLGQITLSGPSFRNNFDTADHNSESRDDATVF